MRELTYFVAVSLDGCIAAADGDFGAFGVEGDHIEMIVRDYVDTLPAPALSAMEVTATGQRFSTVLMGWNTYAAGHEQGVVDPYPHLEQVVFTRDHVDEPVPTGVRVVCSDPVAEVQQLKAEPGTGIWLCGGGQLAAALVNEIDRLVLKVNPVLLGRGRPLFDLPGGAGAFTLEASRAFASGVVVNEYRSVPMAQLS
ncbi:dihydrofolate reductase family protein [Aeromicrobium sp. CF3.5]|uniref:dihydrofolate reductase family protein n=1 Tax=Aeromicrobium sp. CF3.5 TaxID=3373078 RepID=UPI003EE66E7C